MRKGVGLFIDFLRKFKRQKYPLYDPFMVLVGGVEWIFFKKVTGFSKYSNWSCCVVPAREALQTRAGSFTL